MGCFCLPRAFLSGIFWLVICLIFASSNGYVNEDERRALLQLRDSLNYPNGTALVQEWVGDQYCDWEGVFCASNSDGGVRVLNLDLTSKRQKGLGIWYPNASLISRFENLESLYLSGNYIGSWVMPEALCKLSNLKLLDLSSNPLQADIVPDFKTCNLSSLEELQISNIFLTGRPPIPVLRSLCGLKNLRSLDLSYNGINDGQLPPCLPSNLTLLESLDLSQNNLWNSSRVVADLCSLRNLRKLDLSDNSRDDVSIPSCLFHSQSPIESLDISLNNLKGSSNIFSDICKLKSLQMLDLKGNLIQGEIDPCLSKLTSLVSLDLSANFLAGNIPSTMFNNLTSLETLIISDNKLTGKLYFAALANLSNLEDIDLSNNDLLVITESPSWTPSFQLVSLNLRNCGLNRYNGSAVPSFISSQKKIRVIFLSYNSLVGALPSWLLYNTTVELLSLRANSFSGEIPESSSSLAPSNVLMLDISDNQLYGLLPRTIHQLFPKLFYINMSFNALVGEIPSAYGNLTDLEVLDLSNNFLQGKIPLSLRQNHTSLAQLVLSNSNFLGQNVPSFTNMSNLAYLLLQNVGFSGYISNTMMNLPVLKVLDISWNSISGEIPNWFDTFPNLGIILLSRNQFHGNIPSSMCRMQNLNVLDISANYIIGSIPSCLSNITSWKKELGLLLPSFMWLSDAYVNYRVKVSLTAKGNSQPYEGIPLSFVTAIDLSLNQLTGEIPSQLGELVVLRSLNLSFNALSSLIPKSIAAMKQIESLDLSHNQLEGSIPPEMIDLHFISTFNVSHNNLKGSIPFENNFRTFDESSYLGNAGLCGPPLHASCSTQNNKLPDQNEEEDETGFADDDFFYFSCIAVSYVLGFWVVILPLILSKSWRYKYYAGVDSCISICCNKFSSFWSGSWNC
ncbi:OLC1v1017186C1 [Oldenlandia corymbosa var. corymbosa]|uniref:OLC1v1017186C1 n=1 Tax=Oldenlandia corymbosa var. corymbosa TaxID=529605 RepID=A0AAV1E8U5_OLDCO|nr:OLC1v1017186C1 [Oldenlandia corymbosa var. corymbosa]